MGIVTEMPQDTPSTNALDNLPLQQPLIDAAYVRFTGSSAGALEDPPELDETRTYVVTATCKQVNHSMRKDNEERVTTVMEISVLHEQGKTPAKAAEDPALFDEDEDAGE